MKRKVKVLGITIHDIFTVKFHYYFLVKSGNFPYQLETGSQHVLFCGWWFMLFNATFNNSSVISWWSVLLVEETGENHRPVTSH